MRMHIIKSLAAAALLPLSLAAQAGLITDWEGTGVNFESSWIDASTMRIEIDAANRTGGWASAVNIDSIALNSPDSWSWVNASDITLTGPGSFGGAVSGTGLNANGCQGLTLGGNHQCWSGLASLTDNMIFDFSFTGDSIVSANTDNPHLKVRFVNDDGRKVGSLLSADLESVREVPEPTTIALLGLGLICTFVARRNRWIEKGFPQLKKASLVEPFL